MALSEGIDLDLNVLVEVLQNKLAASAVREAQMESAIQSLIAERDREMVDKQPGEGVIQVAPEPEVDELEEAVE